MCGVPPSQSRAAAGRGAARRAVVRLAVAALAGSITLAGCGRPPEVVRSPPPVPTRSAIARPTIGPPTRPTVAAGTRTGGATPVFDEQTARPCAGFPASDRVVALLRRTGVIPGSGTVTVTTEPQCAGTWQYTVVAVPERDPLQVVTRGAPTALELVAAGTDVCTVDVRALAPAGIRAITRCADAN